MSTPKRFHRKAPLLDARTRPSLVSYSEIDPYTDSRMSDDADDERTMTTPHTPHPPFTILNAHFASTVGSDTSYQPPNTPLPTSPETSHASALSAYHQPSSQSFNSVRPPDILHENRNILPPRPLPHIPTFLYRPRAPPALRAQVLTLPFRSILRRYNLFAQLVDDYQQWHGRQVFAFWTQREERAVREGRASAEIVAAYAARPSVPPRVLASTFQVVLLMAPVLSHLIERYHRDLGYDYFAFFHRDPRVYVCDETESLRMVGFDFSERLV